MGMTLEIGTIVVLGLATYRLAWLIARDEGAFGACAWLRGHIDPHQRTWVGRGLNCAGWISFSLALCATVVMHASWIDWLAVAGLSAWLARL